MIHRLLSGARRTASPAVWRIATAGALAVLTCLQPLHAHDVWAERAVYVRFGEPDEAPDTYAATSVKRVLALGEGGAEIPVEVRDLGQHGVLAVPRQDAAVKAVAIDWSTGYRLKRGEKWEAVPDAEALAAGGWKHRATGALTIFAWDASLAATRGRDVELLPQADPFTVAPGSPLPLLALRAGKPVAGLTVRVGDGDEAATFTSDAEGRLACPLPASGLVILKGSLTETEAAGERTLSASVVFTLPAPAAPR